MEHGTWNVERGTWNQKPCGHRARIVQGKEYTR